MASRRDEREAQGLPGTADRDPVLELQSEVTRLRAENTELRIELASRRARDTRGSDPHDASPQALIADRLVSVGTMAAGLAHEINNPLAYVLGNIELVLTAMRELGQNLQRNPDDFGLGLSSISIQLERDHLQREILELVDALQDARSGAERVRDVVRDLAALSRDGSETPATDPRFPRAPGSGPGPRKVLVVDDDAQVLAALARGLGRDHDVTTETSGRAAIERIRGGERYDVILCDLMMPETSGIAVHEELLRIATEQAACMVFLTGGAFTPEARSFLEQVDNPRVSKPFDFPALRELIASAPQSSGSQ